MKSNGFSTPEYLSPSCKTINLSLERTILGDSGNYGNPGQPGGNAGNNPIDPEFDD